MTGQEKTLFTLGKLFGSLSSLETAIGQQKPELIAMSMGKLIQEYNALDKEFITDCKDFVASKLK